MNPTKLAALRLEVAEQVLELHQHLQTTVATAEDAERLTPARDYAEMDSLLKELKYARAALSQATQHINKWL